MTYFDSRPVNRDTYGAQLWRHILTEQLMVTEEEFWLCVDEGVLPARGLPRQAPPNALPASLVYQLLHEVGLSEQAVAKMTRDEAIARMQQHWSEPPSEK